MGESAWAAGRLPASVGAGSCPDCGSRLSAERWSDGLCLSCLLDLGLSDPARTNPGDAAGPTRDPTARTLVPGEILGQRYRIRSLLGSGGMGDVYRAFDLKLRVDVALKAVRAALLADDRALEGLRQEVRSAREVVSPNVCRVFDLVELDGRELVSMEFVDGVTLADVLREKSPLDLQEARRIAAQFLAGLEAIHAADLVHRDVKPENVMITRAGRVVVMDFGIARAVATVRGGTISGTPAYMASEHVQGEIIDARADVFAAGVILAEMVASGGVRNPHAREEVWRGVHHEPPRLDDTPWAGVLRKAVARLRDQRYSTAAALSRALDEVTLRTSGDESQRPYPGLAAFTERDADFFVGRELEIEEMWKKLRRPHLLALIGPSGAGKSSFLRAGLGPSAPAGWRVVFATPSNRPFAALAHALAPELVGDAEAVARLIDFEQPGVAVDVVSRWRRRHDQALLVLDQFEELFTQSPRGVQEQFVQLLAQLALDADVHVLLSMRDDFLFQCNGFESLAPVFSELTAIGPPTGAALRRALVQPALKCGYRFEDEAVVEEMLAQVAGERGALPLVAFAMSKLWDARDRERGLLSRAAYQQVGGVGGALAQHAEATLDSIGQEHLPVVRELFRNLVTAQGTRATLDRDELLSVFGDEGGSSAAGNKVSQQQKASKVLDALVDARLLTSYEPPSIEPDATSRRRIEIVHESLLTSWPRLVRWQTQDQDGAQLRDQLRQAARLWEERGKPEDLLWTGTSFREYELWRERYAGTLSASEDTFAHAMTARTLRRRRQRRIGVAAVTAAALAVTIAMGVLWRRSEGARAEAVSAARRAEAQQLFTLGQAELGQNPTATVAYALASLERDDSPHARRLALRALWQGPPAFLLARTDDSWPMHQLSFSNDGEWLAALSDRTSLFRQWRSDGSAVREIPITDNRSRFASGDFAEDSRSFVVTTSDSIRTYSLPDGKEIRRIAGSFRWGYVRGRSVITAAFVEPTSDGRPRRLIRSYPLPEGAPETNLGVLTFPPGAAGAYEIDRTGQSMFGLHAGGSLFEFPLHDLERAEPRLVVRGDRDPLEQFILSSDGTRIYALHKSGVWQEWPRATVVDSPTRVLAVIREQLFDAAVSADGHWLAAARSQAVDVWDLAGSAASEPLALRSGGRPASVAIDPSGSWLAVQDNRTVSLWPLSKRHPSVLRGFRKGPFPVLIDPGGRWIAATGETGTTIKIWPLQGQPGIEARTLDIGAAPSSPLHVSPRGDRLIAGTSAGVRLIPLDDRPPERLAGFNGIVTGLALDPTGNRVAGSGGVQGELVAPGEAVVRVWNLDTREVTVLDAGDGQPSPGLEFMPDGRLLAAGPAGLRLWDLRTRTSTLLMEGRAVRAVPSADGRYVLVFRAESRPGGAVGTAAMYDMQNKRSWDLPSHGSEVTAVVWGPSEQVITGSRDGIVRVGKLTGEEPHLLMGHEGTVVGLQLEPGGRWIASGGDDGTVRMWPMPEGQPFHTLSHDELLERLRAVTNYRVVEDAATPGGYRLDFEPFKGWKGEPPRW